MVQSMTLATLRNLLKSLNEHLSGVYEIFYIGGWLEWYHQSENMCFLCEFYLRLFPQCNYLISCTNIEIK